MASAPGHLPAITRRTAATGGLAAVALAACGGSGMRVLLSSDTHPAGYPTVEAVQEMGRLLSERTNGRLGVRVYAGGQLGAERDTLEITTFGGLDMNRVFMSPLNAIEPDTTIPSLPFLFQSKDHMRRALDGAPGRAILDTLEKHGLIGLCYYDSGERSFYNTRKPIYTPDDMKGMKIRTPNSDLSVATINATGANATPMDLGEVYQSLVQGVIDGAENNWPSFESGRHFEAAPYYSLTRHVMTPEVLLMSKARWDRLSSADRDIVMACARDSVPFMRKLWDERVEGARTRLLAAGVKENEVIDRAAFVRLMKPVYDQFVTTPFQKRLVADIEAMAASS
ncbi:MAG: C4-dicarboxylate ABC transporter [Alphaproteobacteria bacterium 32-64-14]|nr:MAG: C4-dicarboxylate ABC transporter [Alphaproteobacteria bacterium 32-64-14]